MNNLMRAWDDAFDNFHYRAIDMNNENNGVDYSVPAHVLDGQAGIQDFDVYAAGALEFVTTMKKLLAKYYIPQSRQKLQTTGYSHRNCVYSMFITNLN